MKILDVMWVGDGQFGIVKVEDDYDGIRFYGAPTVSGNTPEEDAEHIAQWGNTIVPETFERFFET